MRSEQSLEKRIMQQDFEEQKELGKECDRLRSMIKKLSQPGPTIIPIGPNEWLKVTGNKKSELSSTLKQSRKEKTASNS